MDFKNQIITDLLNYNDDIRYVAVYQNEELAFRQRQLNSDSSSSESDKYEELLVNPTLLTVARQRGNIDCGGLNFIIIAYGNFYQMIKEIKGGHISICLDKNVDLSKATTNVLEFMRSKYFELEL